MNTKFFGIPVHGYGLTLEYRYHLKKQETRVLNGFYLSPWLRYQDDAMTAPLNILDKDGHKIGKITASFSAAQYIAGGLIGYEHAGKKGFTVDLYAGPYYDYVGFSFSANYSLVSIPFFTVPVNGVWIRTGITFGYAF